MSPLFLLIVPLLLPTWSPTPDQNTTADHGAVIVREHDSHITSKSPLSGYPPEEFGYPASLMPSRDFRTKIGIKKDKKNHGFGNPGEFFRLHQMIRTRAGEEIPAYPQNYRLRELLDARDVARMGDRLPWTDRGPANVSGRTRAILVDPADAAGNTWLAGSVAGGIWKTIDAGQSWAHKTADLPNLSISTMAYAASNPDVIYAGTGEGFYNLDGVRGDGILKSIDRGESWQQLENSVEFSAVNRLVVDPEHEDILLAAVQANPYEPPSGSLSRIVKSVDGGESWYTVYEDPYLNRIQHILAHPTSFDTLYATVNSIGVIQSTDAGETWDLVLNISAANAGRLELAVAPSNPDIVYATLDRTGVYSRLYRTEDAGISWTYMSSQTPGSGVPNWLGSQGWYDNAIAVAPYDPNEVYLGGIYFWKKDETSINISDVQENGTQVFMDLFPWGGYQGTGVGTGMEFAAAVGAPVYPFGLTDDDYVSVQFRFGPNKSQLAHRFSWTGGTEDLPLYQDYIPVPFELWDITNNQQLAVSFFDPEEGGVFELLPLTDPSNPPLAFVMVNAVPYDDLQPDSTVAEHEIGFFYKNTIVIWPLLAPGAEWDPENLPESDLTVLVDDTGEPTARFTALSSGYDPFSDTGTHVDHHNITIIPNDEELDTYRILNGNDGGVFYSDDGGLSWINTLNGYNTTQFYGVDKKPGADEYIGGMQDNGTWQSPPDENSSADSDWLFRIGGDGYEASWNYDNSEQIVAGFQFNGLFRTINGGDSWAYVGDQVDNGSGNAPFVTKVAKTNSDPDLICTVGISGVWRSDDFGASWTLAPRSNPTVGMSNMAQVRFSLANPQIVWMGSRMNDIGMPNAGLHVSTDGAVSFNQVSAYNVVPLGPVTGIATHPTDEETAYALFSFAGAPKIVRTTDLGQTWEDISGFGASGASSNGFPDVATYCLLVMPHDPDILWAGTEIGLFESTDNGVSWHYADNGLPAVSVWQLNVTDDQVVAATHGLGIWTVTIDELPPPPEVTKPPRLNQLAQGPDGFLKIRIDLRSPYDSTRVVVNGQAYLTLPANDSAESLVLDYPVVQPMTVQVQLQAHKDDVAYPSPLRSLIVFPFEEPQNGYVNSFDEATNDFHTSGFQVTNAPGFSSPALHTNHPYADGANLTALLQVPIVVADGDQAFIRFKEVVLVEPGEPGTEFGDPQFWDYVIVEGADDGVTWQPLLDGYDSRTDAAWLDAYQGGQNGTEGLYRDRSIDIGETFATGDTILIRFRLYADEGVTGWGWTIDNLEIQEALSNDSETEAVPSVLLLAQNYPNPFKRNTTIVFALPTDDHVTLKVFDLAGREIRTLLDERKSEGTYELTWDAAGVASGTYIYRLSSSDAQVSRQIVILR